MIYTRGAVWVEGSLTTDLKLFWFRRAADTDSENPSGSMKGKLNAPSTADRDVNFRRVCIAEEKTSARASSSSAALISSSSEEWKEGITATRKKVQERVGMQLFTAVYSVPLNYMALSCFRKGDSK